MTHSRNIVLGMALLAGVAPFFGQQRPNQATTISGKDHPELINDATAYWHLFRILSRSDNEPPEMFQRRRLAFASKTYLAKEQIRLLLRAADTFTEQMTSFTGLPPSPALQEARTNVVLSIVNTLHSNLGEEGSFVLRNYVNGQLKRSIVLFTSRR